MSSNAKKGPWLFVGYIGDDILPSYMVFILNHYKDPFYYFVQNVWLKQEEIYEQKYFP